MAFYCIDYVNGSDVTGDGTASAPWASIAHAETQINAGAGYVTGDEMRIASSPIGAALGQITGTSASGQQSDTVRLNVNTDLTGVLSQYDTVWIDGTTTATSGGGNNMVWQVEAVTATTIDLWANGSGYFGKQMFDDSSSTSVDIKKVTAIEVDVNGFSGYQADTLNGVDTAFPAFNDDVVISGGWDSTNFTAKATYPFTSFSRRGTYQTTSGNVYGAAFTWANNSNGFKFKDFNAARLSLSQDLNFNDCTYGHNLENISVIYHTNYGTGTPSPLPVGKRKYINCQIAAGINTLGRTSDADVYMNQFDSCFLWSQATNNIIYGSNQNGSGQQTELVGSNIHVKAGNFSQYNISGYVSSSAPNTANQPFRTKPLVTDFSTITIIPKSGLGIGLVKASSIARFPWTVEVPSGILNKSGSLGVKHLVYESFVYAGALTFNLADVTDALDLDQPIVAGKMNVGGNPIKVTGDGNTYHLFASKLFAKLNTVDNNLGDNCIELVPTNQASNPILEGPWMPIRFAKGDNITVTIVGKIKGTATSMGPAIRLAGTDAQGPQTQYDNFEGLANFSLTSGSGYNNTTWSTNVYTMTNAFANEAYADYVGQLAIYNDQLDEGDSWLIDSVTIEIS